MHATTNRACRLLARLTSTILAVVVACPVGAAPTDHERNNPAHTRAAAELEKALVAEASGDAVTRSALLQQAINDAPDYAPAQWQAGRVRTGKGWLTIRDAEQQASSDLVVRQYEQLRAETPDTPADHEALGIWCRKHKLVAEGRYHWQKVLDSDPQNVAAQHALDLHLHDGRLLTTTELADAKKQARDLLKANARWRPRLERWRHDAESADEARRTAALAGLKAINDVEVVSVFESLLEHKSNDNRGPAFSIAIVEALGKLRDPKAIEALVRQAILSTWPETRSAAIRQLAQREPINYVPYALGCLQTPWTRRFEINVVGGDTVVYQQELFRESAEVDDYRYSQASFNVANTATLLTKARTSDASALDLLISKQQECMALAERAAQHDSAQVAGDNALIEQRNEAIRALVNSNLKVDYGADADAWWKWWRDYNELQATGYKPVRIHCSQMYERVTPLSCFVAGTLVSTRTGLVAIERIKPGDLVLSQHPQTGELTYKAVLATTTRPPKPTVLLNVGADKIQATRGHRFWHEGRGWQMAKQLVAGIYLRSATGPVRLDTADPADQREAFNLVVDEFHTYFVGSQRILVHDNTAPRPTSGTVPGQVLSAISEHEGFQLLNRSE